MLISRKKRTIGVFLNKRLKPIIIDQEKAYPIYIGVTFDRKSTQFPINLEVCGKSWRCNYATEDEFNRIQEGLNYQKNNLDLDFRVPSISIIIKMIEDILEFEIERLEKEFSLKGFSAKVDFFFQNVIDSMGKELTNELTTLLSETDFSSFSKLMEESKPFYQNYEHVCGLILSGAINIANDFKLKIETFFLLAAAVEKYFHLNSLYFWHFCNGKSQFELFLSENTSLFDKSKVLKLPLLNFFVRYVSLNPPSKDSSFYPTRIEMFVNKLVDSHYYSLLSQIGQETHLTQVKALAGCR